ncbi:MAG: hypothetical protein ACP5NS_03135 [Candidatus Pacearchaeota archaeon]
MSEENSLAVIDSRVIDYARNNKIVITPTENGPNYRFAFFRGTDELGEMTYDRTRGVFLGSESPELARRLKTPGLVTVMRDFARLVMARKGDFYHEGFDRLHEVLDSNENFAS